MTLRMIAGIVTPDRGKIVLNGRVLFDRATGRTFRQPVEKSASCFRITLSSRI